MPITEADTCRKYVLPKLYDAGWADDQITEQKTFTYGRIIVLEGKCKRGKQKLHSSVQALYGRNY
jgi:type I restriction enzyme R subunit